MSNRDISLDPKILVSAKKEFLEKGFLNASLKTICHNAGVTTGAIYRRYKGKEELFADVVKPAVDMFKALMEESFKNNKKRADEDRLDDNWTEFSGIIKYWIKKLYKEKETVIILLSKTEGTSYCNFIHDFVEENYLLSYEFMKQLEKEGRMDLNLSSKEYHILITSYWRVMFEMIIEGFTVEEALDFAPKIQEFFAWEKFIIFK